MQQFYMLYYYNYERGHGGHSKNQLFGAEKEPTGVVGSFSVSARETGRKNNAAGNMHNFTVKILARKPRYLFP